MLRLLSVIFIFVAGAANAQDTPAPAPEVWKTIELEWESVDKAVGYEVKLTPEKGGSPRVLQSPDNKLSQQVPIGNYKLQIRAKDKDGEMSPWSEPTDLEVAIKEIIPLHPEDKAEMMASGGGKQPVEFKWTPVDKVRVYTLKVWSEDKKDHPWVFTGRATQKTLEVPPGRTYYWQVLFESANDVSYNQEPKTFSFVLQGTALLKPEFMPYKAGQDLKWKGSDETQAYQTKIFYRHLDETEWTLLKQTDLTENKLAVAGMKAGAYKVEIVATAARRLNSVPAQIEFMIKPTALDLAKAMP